MCSSLCDSMNRTRLLCPWDFPGENMGVGSLSLLRGIFQTRGLNPGLLLCRQILYCLSHQGSPKLWEKQAQFLSECLCFNRDRHKITPFLGCSHSSPAVPWKNRHPCLFVISRPFHPHTRTSAPGFGDVSFHICVQTHFYLLSQNPSFFKVCVVLLGVQPV